MERSPEPAAGTGQVTEESTANLAGEVRLKSIAASMSDNAVLLPKAGEYGVVVHVRDDPRIDELEEGSFAQTAERRLVQLWSMA